jgi:peroxiredoxin
MQFRLSTRTLVPVCFIAIMSTLLFAKSLPTARVPDITLKTLKGGSCSLAQHLGTGPIVINFWATWCSPCILEMKKMKKMYEKYKPQDLQVLSISVDDSKTEAQIPGVVRTYKFPYTFLLDPNKEAYKAFHASNVPELFVVDKHGAIVYSHKGYQKGDERTVEAVVARLVGEQN